ncbi:hypothetical protein [Flexibacterium corallicola]|uniref:hypothetical protein n=1 Tax=Flexibacterium corallicola TaxID=3037259 RepID=UPI00286F61BE|nr:hypothetical protein [Pseudovibrio sp. M1P-2-3]
MDRKRVQRLSRILKVQEQRERLIKYDVAALDQKLNDLEGNSEELQGYWGSHDGQLRELMNQVISRKLKSNERDKARLTSQKEGKLQELQEYQRQTKVTEKKHKVANRDFQREQEKGQLADMAELQVLKHWSGPDKTR